MIIKNTDLKNFTSKFNYFLFYGPNQGLINEKIENVLKPTSSKNIFLYDENEIVAKEDFFFESISNKSFFDKDKLIIIDRVTDRILPLIQKILSHKFEEIKIIFKSEILEKKSKLRSFFEKNNQIVIVPFYEDNQQSLTTLALNILNQHKIKITMENLNLIVRKASGNRLNLKNELTKIIQYCQNKSSINQEEILKIVNLSENFKISDLIDNYLLNNKKGLINTINENNFSEEDNILILRTFLSKLKRLKKLKESTINLNIELAISKFRPVIFWKDKNIIEQQLKKLNLKQINTLIKSINYLEVEIKRNFKLSKNLINDFFLEKNIINNYF